MLPGFLISPEVDTYRIAHNANGVPPSQSRQAHRQSCAKMKEAVEERVVRAAVRGRGAYVAGDEDSDDEGVDRNNTSHDDRDERLRVSL